MSLYLPMPDRERAEIAAYAQQCEAMTGPAKMLATFCLKLLRHARIQDAVIAGQASELNYHHGKRAA